MSITETTTTTIFGATWKRLRETFSRDEWAVRLLGLSRYQSGAPEPGLILVQIDGLSKTQLERAISKGRMPFLRSLVAKRNYKNHTFYSGLPSSTPSVQGELYYGHRTVVPAFGFRDHQTGRLVRMFSSDIAQDVEQKLRRASRGLLEGGSSYCNNYGGGAKDVHFCATSFGWSEFLQTVNPIKLALVMLLHFWMFVRILGLMIIEFFLAVFGFFRGIFSGRKFWQELIMIPARVVVVVLLRELVTLGACHDASRGLPIVHLNLLGYDEQAHRRGPGSRFAHWTLRGIDDAIGRIWRSTKRDTGRRYQLWIFSDHGQESTRPYQLTHRKLIQEVVAEMVDDSCQQADSAEGNRAVFRLSGQREARPTRATWLGFGPLVTMLFGEQDYDIQSRSPYVQTVTSGPLGFVYLLSQDLKRLRGEIARRLVHESNVPMAVYATGPSRATVTTIEGSYLLPNDTVQVFGADHPFLDDIAQDLIRLAHHEDSGEIILVGWTHKSVSTSFVLQNGAHAGPGIEETRGFALLPCDAPTPQTDKRYLRPNDLRLAALSFLGRESKPSKSVCEDNIKPDEKRRSGFKTVAEVEKLQAISEFSRNSATDSAVLNASYTSKTKSDLSKRTCRP